MAPMGHENSILVIGGGLTGGAVAFELARAGRRVLLIERQQAPSWKIGETLPPESQIHLQRLQHWDKFLQDEHLPCYGIVSAWGSGQVVEKDFVFNPYGHGWQLDRARFESRILEAATNAGCHIQWGTSLHRLRRTGTTWQVETSRGSLTAEWIVDCTGRAGTAVSHLGGVVEQVDDLVSIFVRADSTVISDRDARTYIESHPNGWCYSALMPSGFRTIAFQTDRDLVPEHPQLTDWLSNLISECPMIHSLLRQHEYRFENVPRLAAADSRRTRVPCGEGWVAVGDAALAFDPVSGQGTTKALESASLAVRFIVDQCDYSAHCDRIWQAYLIERRDNYRSETRWKELTFWCRRQVVLN
jgi:2-polyprenyl-6-methoxyphenol hydroxylase-like FAD-dependent oxidoreductase